MVLVKCICESGRRMRRLFLFVICLAVVQAVYGIGRAGERKRIGYIEAGPFWVYTHTLAAFKQSMLKHKEFAEEFPPELHISLGWDKGQEEMDAAVKALMERDDVDLILGAGVSACRTLRTKGNGKIPVIGMGMSDPLLAGVIASPDDSGADNFTCEVVVDRWKQMFRVFHDVVGFKKLGVLYSNLLEGVIDSGLSDAMEVGRERGYEVVAHKMPDEGTESCFDGLRVLYEAGIDAFFLGPLSCFDWESADPIPLLERLGREYQLPTFARDGSIFVQGGALMGFATWDFDKIGERLAERATAIFQGVVPRTLPMRVRMEPIISINLQTAREIGFDFPFEVIIAADDIYVTTNRPEVEQVNVGK